MNNSNYITINKKNSVNAEPDKTDTAFRVAQQIKADKVKAKLTLHFDGSGKCSKIELAQDI